MRKENNLGGKTEAKVLDFEASEKIEREIKNVDKIYKELSNDFKFGVGEGLKVALHILKKGASK